jgi:hypothetical protein
LRLSPPEGAFFHVWKAEMPEFSGCLVDDVEKVADVIVIGGSARLRAAM